MKKQITFFALLLFAVQLIMAQMTPMSVDKNKKFSDTNKKVDFIKKYQLEGKKPTTMKLMEEIEMRSAPNCGSEVVSKVIPNNTILDAYKYFPKNQCWAVNYKGEWGFLPSTLLFPVSRHTMDMNRFDIAPRLRSKIKQKYPKQAEKKGITGTVSLKVYVDKNGKVTKTKVEKGIPELNQAAIDAIKDAKFKPAVYKNKNVGVWIPVSFDYN